MSYYIRAYRGPKHLNLPLEEKHKYFNESGASPNYGEKEISTYPNNGFQQNMVAIDKFIILHKSDDFTLLQGTGDDTRTGNKIALTSIDFTIYIRLNIDTFIDHIPHGWLQKLFVNFRIMTVRFEKAMGQADLMDWYKNTYIYYSNLNTASVPALSQSCHQEMKRESSPWTGKFSILKEMKLKLTYNKGIKQLHYRLDPHMNLNFDETNHVTNENFSHTYTFVVAPIDYRLDFDGTSFHYLNALTNTTYSLAKVGYNIKYTFYDLD